jgi:hypothetical protein
MCRNLHGSHGIFFNPVFHINVFLQNKSSRKGTGSGNIRALFSILLFPVAE